MGHRLGYTRVFYTEGLSSNLETILQSLFGFLKFVVEITRHTESRQYSGGFGMLLSVYLLGHFQRLLQQFLAFVQTELHLVQVR